MKLIMKKGVAYTGLADVFGGKLWFSVKNETDNELRYFYTKKECEKYIRKTFTKETKKALLNQLRDCKGRVYMSK